MPAEAVFVAAGELEDSLRREAAGSGVPAIFHGFQNQKPDAVALCHGRPSRAALRSPGDLGAVVNEAMVCGVPAVVSDAVGCGPDLIDAGRTGAVFPLGNTTALARAIQSTLALETSSVASAFERKDGGLFPNRGGARYYRGGGDPAFVKGRWACSLSSGQRWPDALTTHFQTAEPIHFDFSLLRKAFLAFAVAMVVMAPFSRDPLVAVVLRFHAVAPGLPRRSAPNARGRLVLFAMDVGRGGYLALLVGVYGRRVVGRRSVRIGCHSSILVLDGKSSSSLR